MTQTNKFMGALSSPTLKYTTVFTCSVTESLDTPCGKMWVMTSVYDRYVKKILIASSYFK